MPLNAFEINIPSDHVASLVDRLRSAVWAAEPTFADPWEYGVPAEYLRQLIEYWLDRYDWSDQQAAMNRWQHLRGDVDGVTIHVLVEHGSGHSPVPLILSHGWPWTFWDFAKVIEPLAHPERFGGDSDDGFDVIVPSLPGSVFSPPPPRRIGWQQTAGLWVRLMDELGYDRFGAHGGDSGAFVTAQLAHEFPDRLIGGHLTYPALLSPAAQFTRDDFAPDEVADFAGQRDPTTNMTHFLTHTLEPQTIGWGLQDSPLGLAAWMLQRRAAWSDCKGDVENRFTKDELITSFALYWLTNTVTSSLRFYADSFRTPWQPTHSGEPTLRAPIGIASFPKELSHVPRSVAERYANLVHWTRMPSGGHFAPMEEPQLLIDDLRGFFRPLRR
jgi:pimeloyl-ACP methyl ester carboxylesterase